MATTNKENWNLLSQRTEATIQRSYMKNGQHYGETEVLRGTPEEVKRMAAPRNAGEVNEVVDVHTISRYERENHENTNHGVTKHRETRTVQTYDFGDGGPVKTSNNPTGKVFANEDDEQEFGKGPMDKTDVVKNMLDKHIDNNISDKEETGRNYRFLMWVAVCALVLAAFGAAAFILMVR